VTGTITGVGVLDKAVALIDLVERRPMTASDLAREVGMTLSTAHRLAMALTAHGLLRRDPGGVFHVGPRFTVSSLAEIARPVLQQLRAETGETAQLWVRRGDQRVVAASADSDQELRAVLLVGSALPLSAGGSAALVLSDDGGPVHGGGPPEWVESMSQRTPGLGSVSAPVRQHGEVVAAVCLPAPLARVQPSPGAVYGQSVVRAARAIEQALRG
jgi:DNA-binding IclR family transcriptional regulator